MSSKNPNDIITNAFNELHDRNLTSDEILLHNPLQTLRRLKKEETRQENFLVERNNMSVLSTSESEVGSIRQVYDEKDFFSGVGGGNTHDLVVDSQNQSANTLAGSGSGVGRVGLGESSMLGRSLSYDGDLAADSMNFSGHQQSQSLLAMMGAPLTEEQLQIRRQERRRRRRFQEQKKRLLRLVRKNFLEELEKERRTNNNNSSSSVQQRRRFELASDNDDDDEEEEIRSNLRGEGSKPLSALRKSGGMLKIDEVTMAKDDAEEEKNDPRNKVEFAFRDHYGVDSSRACIANEKLFAKEMGARYSKLKENVLEFLREGAQRKKQEREQQQKKQEQRERQQQQQQQQQLLQQQQQHQHQLRREPSAVGHQNNSATTGMKQHQSFISGGSHTQSFRSNYHHQSFTQQQQQHSTSSAGTSTSTIPAGLTPKPSAQHLLSTTSSSSTQQQHRNSFRPETPSSMFSRQQQQQQQLVTINNELNYNNRVKLPSSFIPNLPPPPSVSTIMSKLILPPLSLGAQHDIDKQAEARERGKLWELEMLFSKALTWGMKRHVLELNEVQSLKPLPVDQALIQLHGKLKEIRRMKPEIFCSDLFYFLEDALVDRNMVQPSLADDLLLGGDGSPGRRLRGVSRQANKRSPSRPVKATFVNTDDKEDISNDNNNKTEETDGTLGDALASSSTAGSTLRLDASARAARLAASYQKIATGGTNNNNNNNNSSTNLLSGSKSFSGSTGLGASLPPGAERSPTFRNYESSFLGHRRESQSTMMLGSRRSPSTLSTSQQQQQNQNKPHDKTAEALAILQKRLEEQEKSKQWADVLRMYDGSRKAGEKSTKSNAAASMNHGRSRRPTWKAAGSTIKHDDNRLYKDPPPKKTTTKKRKSGAGKKKAGSNSTRRTPTPLSPSSSKKSSPQQHGRHQPPVSSSAASSPSTSRRRKSSLKLPKEIALAASRNVDHEDDDNEQQQDAAGAANKTNVPVRWYFATKAEMETRSTKSLNTAAAISSAPDGKEQPHQQPIVSATEIISNLAPFAKVVDVTFLEQKSVHNDGTSREPSVAHFFSLKNLSGSGSLLTSSTRASDSLSFSSSGGVDRRRQQHIVKKLHEAEHLLGTRGYITVIPHDEEATKQLTSQMNQMAASKYHEEHSPSGLKHGSPMLGGDIAAQHASSRKNSSYGGDNDDGQEQQHHNPLEDYRRGSLAVSTSSSNQQPPQNIHSKNPTSPHNTTASFDHNKFLAEVKYQARRSSGVSALNNNRLGKDFSSQSLAGVSPVSTPDQQPAGSAFLRMQPYVPHPDDIMTAEQRRVQQFVGSLKFGGIIHVAAPTNKTDEMGTKEFVAKNFDVDPAVASKIIQKTKDQDLFPKNDPAAFVGHQFSHDSPFGDDEKNNKNMMRPVALREDDNVDEFFGSTTDDSITIVTSSSNQDKTSSNKPPSPNSALLLSPHKKSMTSFRSKTTPSTSRSGSPATSGGIPPRAPPTTSTSPSSRRSPSPNTDDNNNSPISRNQTEKYSPPQSYDSTPLPPRQQATTALPPPSATTASTSNANINSNNTAESLLTKTSSAGKISIGSRSDSKQQLLSPPGEAVPPSSSTTTSSSSATSRRASGVTGLVVSAHRSSSISTNASELQQQQQQNQDASGSSSTIKQQGRRESVVPNDAIAIQEENNNINININNKSVIQYTDESASKETTSNKSPPRPSSASVLRKSPTPTQATTHDPDLEEKTESPQDAGASTTSAATTKTAHDDKKKHSTTTTDDVASSSTLVGKQDNRVQTYKHISRLYSHEKSLSSIPVPDRVYRVVCEMPYLVGIDEVNPFLNDPESTLAISHKKQERVLNEKEDEVADRVNEKCKRHVPRGARAMKNGTVTTSFLARQTLERHKLHEEQEVVHHHHDDASSTRASSQTRSRSTSPLQQQNQEGQQQTEMYNPDEEEQFKRPSTPKIRMGFLPPGTRFPRPPTNPHHQSTAASIVSSTYADVNTATIDGTKKLLKEKTRMKERRRQQHEREILVLEQQRKQQRQQEQKTDGEQEGDVEDDETNEPTMTEKQEQEEEDNQTKLILPPIHTTSLVGKNTLQNKEEQEEELVADSRDWKSAPSIPRARVAASTTSKTTLKPKTARKPIPSENRYQQVPKKPAFAQTARRGGGGLILENNKSNVGDHDGQQEESFAFNLTSKRLDIAVAKNNGFGLAGVAKMA